jgi:molybdate transport system permease protein
MRTAGLLLLIAALVTPRLLANDEAGGSVLIAAAASTTDAVESICAEFERQHPGVRVRTSLGSSSALAKQIVAGAQVDVFLSASDEWADLVANHGLVAARRELLGNRLVVVVSVDSNLTLSQPADLLSDDIKHLALADPASVPAGIYARQALESLGLWEHLTTKVAAGSDVRQALHFVSTGAAEAGIVYASDALSDPAVHVALELPAELSAGIRYPLVLVKCIPDNPAARRLYDFLTSPAATEKFGEKGFVVLNPSAAVAPVGGDARDSKVAALRSWWSLSAEEWSALRLSAQVGVWAVLMSLPLAIVVGYFLARGTARAKWLVELLVNLPLVMPPVVTGYLLLVLLAPRGPLGSLLESWFNIRIVFTWFGAAVAAAVVSFPLMVRAIRLAFQSVDPRLEQAARTLGARRWDAFCSISLPLARSGVLAGAVLAFARSLGEFGATIMVAGNIVGRTQTIPLAIFSQAHRPGVEAQVEVWRLVVISIVLAAAALFASEWLERRHVARESA